MSEQPELGNSSKEPRVFTISYLTVPGSGRIHRSLPRAVSPDELSRTSVSVHSSQGDQPDNQYEYYFIGCFPMINNCMDVAKFRLLPNPLPEIIITPPVSSPTPQPQQNPVLKLIGTIFSGISNRLTRSNSVNPGEGASS